MIRCLNVESFLREHLSIDYIKILGNNSSVDALLQKRKVRLLVKSFRISYDQNFDLETWRYLFLRIFLSWNIVRNVISLVVGFCKSEHRQIKFMK